MEGENLQFDEKLSESVRRFPCLFDKSKADYKDKHIVKNAWAKVAEEICITDGSINLFLFKINGGRQPPPPPPNPTQTFPRMFSSLYFDILILGGYFLKCCSFSPLSTLNEDFIYLKIPIDVMNQHKCIN